MTSTVRAALGGAVEALPETLSLALRPARYRYDNKSRPQPRPVPAHRSGCSSAKPTKAAQGYWFPRASKRLPDIGAGSMHVLGPDAEYGFPTDVGVPAEIFRHSTHWRREQFDIVSQQFTHVIMESGHPLFGKLFDHDPVTEIDASRDSGVSVALLAHGSKMRRPTRHELIDEWSPYRNGWWLGTPQSERLVTRFHVIIERASVPVFVTTPDMLPDWPTATWIPLAIDPGRWVNTSPVLQRARPVVVHASTNPHLKNTALIEPTLYQLDDEGVIGYRLFPSVTIDNMPGLIADADVVLDEFGAGRHSVASVEGTASRRVTIAQMHEQAREVVRSTLGLEVPMVSATPVRAIGRIAPTRGEAR